MKSWLGLFSGILPLIFVVSCGGPGADRDSSDVLVVGMELTYPPFEMRDGNNQPDGISVRMAEGLAESLGRELVIRDVQFSGIIPALTSGKIDVIISSMTRTPKRAETISFSDGYVTNGLCMLVGKDSDIQSVEDLKTGKHKIACKLATTGYIWVKEHLPEVELVSLDDAASCALEVVQGKVDAFIYDQISVYQFWKKYPEETKPILNPIREETWAIGMRKGDDELRQQVNAFLAEYRAAGMFDQLADRYMSEQKQAFEKMGVPFIFH